MAVTTRSIPTDPCAFLVWENRQRARYELVGGMVRLMTGGTAGHNLIAQNTAFALRQLLGTRHGCVVHQSDVKVVAPTGMVTYPDVMLRCGGLVEDATEVDDPLLIVEVLSPRTRREDLIRKRYGYQAIPTLRWLLYIEPKNVQVEVVSREAADRWRTVFLTDLSAAVRLDELGVELPLADLYAGLEAGRGAR